MRRETRRSMQRARSLLRQAWKRFNAPSEDANGWGDGMELIAAADVILKKAMGDKDDGNRDGGTRNRVR